MAGPTIPQTRMIALMNQKGGVGKTTTAVNLAAAVALQGRRVLIIDLDPQAHATLHLGHKTGDDRPSVYDLLLDPSITLAEAAVESRPNLFLLPAETDLAGAETELAGVPDRLTRLRTRLEAHREPFEFVFVDCPPSLGVLTLNGLAAVREVFIPMQAHFLALQGVSKLLETVAAVGQSVNPRLAVTGVVLCVHDTSTSHSREVVADLDEFFENAKEGADSPWRSARVYRPAIRRNVKLAEAPSFGKTIFEYAPWCPGGIDYRTLGESLISEWDAMRERMAKQAEAGPAANASPSVVTRSRSGAKA